MEYKVILHFVIYVTEKRAYKFHSFAYIRKFIFVSRHNNYIRLLVHKVFFFWHQNSTFCRYFWHFNVLSSSQWHCCIDQKFSSWLVASCDKISNCM